jgi:uncharacterized sulfatase
MFRNAIWFCVAAVLVGSLRVGAADQPASSRPPNVLMIVADDMGWTDFGFMGHKVVRTPDLDRLAGESAVFPNGYVPTSLCRASLATLLTGEYAHQHRICCNDPPEGVARSAMHPFIREAPAVPRLLGGAGYASFQTGKFWEGHFSNAGFTDGMTTRGRHGEDGLVIGRRTMKPVYDFIGRSGDKPWFVWYAPMMPHEPHDPPARLLEKYKAPGRPLKLAEYYAMCEWFDETCGRLLAYLDEHGLRDNTLVVFVVDNGWIQETGKDRTTRGQYAPKSKMSPYDGGLRTPVMLRWPGHTKPGRHDDLVSTIDVAPTVLAAAGLKQPPAMPGLNLLDVAGGKGRLKRDAVFGEIFVHTAVDIERPALNLTHRWLRRGDWKLITFDADRKSPELYDLRRDPFEEHDLAARNPERVQELNAVLHAWWAGR